MLPTDKVMLVSDDPIVNATPVVVANVPEVGNVTAVVAVKVPVKPKAPEKVTAAAVVRAPPSDKANAPHVGAAVDPDNNGNLTVAVPAKIANALDAEYTMPPVLAVNAAFVPPLAKALEVPVHVPVPMVPTVVMLVCTAEGNVEDMLGTPVPLVMSTPLLPVVSPATVFAAELYNN